MQLDNPDVPTVWVCAPPRDNIHAVVYMNKILSSKRGSVCMEIIPLSVKQSTHYS